MRWPWSRRRHTFDSAPKPIDLLFAEMLGRTSSAPVGRSEALSVPAVAQGRNALCAIATLPLTQLDPKNALAPSPLLDQLDPDVPNVVTLAQTVEDLVFDAIAWWMITAQDFAGFPVAVRHLDVGQVSLQPPTGRNPAPLPSGVDPRQGIVWVDGKPIAASRVIRFDSPNPAVRKVGGRAIRRAILLDRAANSYAQDPRPADYFTPTDGADPASDDDITQILSTWRWQRRTHGTAYVPASLQYHDVDVMSPREMQLVDLQRQVNLDIANLFGLDSEDLGVSTTSRTYQNAVDRRLDRINDTLAPFMRAITDRLSMGDVTRRGYRVVFDLDNYLKADPETRWGVYETQLRIKATTVEEIRAKEGEPPLAASDTADEALEAEVEEETTVTQIDAHRGSVEMNFARPTTLTFVDAPTTSFSVDSERRTISGVVVPYGKVAMQAGMKFRFKRHALNWSDVSRIKLLVDHDTSRAVGVMTKATDRADGMHGVFKIARGDEGDRALMLAEDGVLDGFSVGVDFDSSVDAAPDPRQRDVFVVNRADWRETSLTAMPSFDDARVTSVAASRTAGDDMGTDTTTEPEAPAPEAPAHRAHALEPSTVAADAAPEQTFTADQVRAMINDAEARFRLFGTVNAGDQAPPEERQTVDPTRRLTLSQVREPVPYRFDRGGNFVPGQEHVFSADLHEMALAGDAYGDKTEAGKRVMGLLHAKFTVETTDVDELNPTIQRPDMYVDQQDFRYPIWSSIDKGAPPNGIQPFTFPKFNSASGLVGDHVAGTEPSSGNFTTTGQTVTPTPVSGKASIQREVWDMGGNPAVSTLIFNQMVRGYREGLESAAATFLNTLTAATDIALPVAGADATLVNAWDAEVAGLTFERGYDFSTFVLERRLYLKFVAAADTTGRKLVPQLNPQNANSQAARRFVTLDLAGVIGVGSWALPSTTGSPNNSWLYDPMFVHGWATAPQRLEFPGTAAGGTYAPVAMVDLAIWGYKALANSDVGAVRQVIYDPV